MTIPMPTQKRIRELDGDGVSARKIARAVGVSRNTVAKYVNQEDFSPSPPVRVSVSIVDEYAPIIERWLETDLERPRKQRHTGRRVYDRLVIEHDYVGSYSTVQRWVKRWRQARTEAGDGFLELVWEPGVAQADFGAADAYIQGIQVTTHMLVVTWPYSNARYAVTMPGETSECVAAGLRNIFEHVGRVPRRIVFDNATGIGKRGRDRNVTTTALFDAFMLHYRFSASFTNPNSGNEKGSVENAVGYIRRNLLVPLPHVESLHGLSSYLLGACDALLQQTHYRKPGTLQALFVDDLDRMRLLPGVGFDACTWLQRRVDKVGNIDLHGTKYFVGDAYTGQQVHVGVRAFTIEARTLAGASIIEHARVYGGEAETVHRPEQFLPGLVRKPGAFEQSLLKENLPAQLRHTLTDAPDHERRRLLKIVAALSPAAGYAATVQVMDELAGTGRRIELSEVEMGVNRARELGGASLNEGTVDLRVYDRFTGGAAA